MYCFNCFAHWTSPAVMWAVIFVPIKMVCVEKAPTCMGGSMDPRLWMERGIDPTNNVWVQNNHVKLAVGRDFKIVLLPKDYLKVARQVLSVYANQLAAKTAYIWRDQQSNEWNRISIYRCCAGTHLCSRTWSAATAATIKLLPTPVPDRQYHPHVLIQPKPSSPFWCHRLFFAYE